MSADSHGGSGSGGTPPDEIAAEPVSREDIESSVLDALRPLLGPKRKKSSSTDGATAVPDATDEPPAEPAVGSTEAATPSALDDTEATEPDATGVSPTIAHAPEADDVSHPDTPAADDTLPFQDEDRTTDMTYHATTTETEDKALDSFVAGRESEEFETFLEIGGDLERRSRRSATMARLLDQHHVQLQTAEKERDEAYEKLARVYPVVQETARALKEAMDSRKVDPDPSRMARLFQLNGRALDELEKVAVTIFADFLWCKSAWELYAKTVGDARELRANADS